MNTFSSLKAFFFPGKLQSVEAPAVNGSTPTLLVPALRQLLPLCRRVPHLHFDFEVQQGQAVLRIHWQPKADAPEGGRRFHYIISDEDGVKEVPCDGPAASQEAGSAPKATPDRRQGNLMRRLSAFLTARYSFRFNLLTEETEVAHREAGAAPDHHLHYEKLDERQVNSLCMDAMEEGVACWDRDVKRFVRSNRVQDYHPFTDYFDRLPQWDGTDRVSPLARRVSDNPVWVSGFHRWMLATAAQWMKLDTGGRANSVAPLLVSSIQGLGKSTFCRMLLPETLRPYYTESFDLASPASAEAKLAAYGLINLDEFDRLGASKTPLLKNLMQMSALNIRKAYKHSASPLHRIASFIGTSNREDLLADRTGSRRFLCVSIDRAIDCNAPVEYGQLYAQLKAELLDGERPWFSKEEEAEIQRNNARFYRNVPEEEVFSLCFRFATEDDAAAEVEQLTAAQIYEDMKKAHPSAMRGMTAYGLSRVLPQLGQRLHTIKGNVYRVVRVKPVQTGPL